MKNKTMIYNTEKDVIELSPKHMLDILRHTRKKVFIVLNMQESRVLGVYANRNAAKKKKERMQDDDPENFTLYALLEFKIKGYAYE